MLNTLAARGLVVRAGQRWKEEVDRVLGGREPDFEDYPKLTYLRQVVDETLRLRGPVAMTARNVVADDEVLGVRVRAGEVVMPYFYGAHRHKDFWADPERFYPCHFAPEKTQGRNPWASTSRSRRSSSRSSPQGARLPLDAGMSGSRAERLCRSVSGRRFRRGRLFRGPARRTAHDEGGKRQSHRRW